MIGQANFSLYFPETKWSGIAYSQAFFRAVLAHVCLFASLFCLVRLIPTPVQRAESAVCIEFVPFVPIDNAGGVRGHRVAVVPLPDPAASPKRLLNQQTPAPSSRRAPIVSSKPLPVENTMPRQIASRSMAVLKTKSAFRSKALMSMPGAGNPYLGAPARPAVSGVAVKSLLPSIKPGSNQASELPAVTKRLVSMIPNAVIFGLPRSGMIPDKQPADLDMQACQLHGEATQLESSDPSRARQLYSRARDLMDEVLRLYKQQLGKDDDPLIALALQNTGRCYVGLHDYTKAKAYYLASIKMYDELLGSNSYQTAVARTFLGDLYMLEGKHRQALEQFQLTLAVYEQRFGNKSKEVGWTYQRLGSAFRALGENNRAKESFALSDALQNAQ